jgi:hypothetical protein
VANPRIALGLRKNTRIRSGEDRNEKEGFNWERGLGCRGGSDDGASILYEEWSIEAGER